MWSTTGPRLDCASFSLKLLTSSGSSSANFQPRGLRVNTWNVSQPSSLARSTAWSILPEIDTWTPTFKPVFYQPACQAGLVVDSFGSENCPKESRYRNKIGEETLDSFYCCLE